MILTSCYQKNSPTIPPTECGWLMVMGEAQNFLLLPPPPTESARLTAIPEQFLLLPPPPTESARLTGTISATTPPPLNLPGLRRSWKISATTPPPIEFGRPLEITENWPPPKKNSWLRRCDTTMCPK